MQNSITRSRDGDRIRLRSRHFSRLFWSIRQNLRRNRYKQVSRQSLTLSLAKRNHSNKTNLERRVRAHAPKSVPTPLSNTTTLWNRTLAFLYVFSFNDPPLRARASVCATNNRVKKCQMFGHMEQSHRTHARAHRRPALCGRQSSFSDDAKRWRRRWKRSRRCKENCERTRRRTSV